MRKTLLAAFSLLSLLLAAQERLGPGKILYVRGSATIPASEASMIVEKAFSLADEAGAAIGIGFAFSQAKTAAKVAFTVSAAPETSAAILEIGASAGRPALSDTVLAQSEAELLGRLPAALVQLGARYFGKRAASAPPLAVAMLDMSLFFQGYGLYPASIPMDIALATDGTLYAPVGDKYFVLGPGLGVREAATPPKAPAGSYYYKAAVTPGGVLYLGTSTMKDILRLVPGAPKSEIIRSGVASYSRLQAFPDGALVLDDQASQGIRKIRKGKAEAFGDKATLPVGATFAIDREGILWSYDAYGQTVKRFSSDGALLGEVKPAFADGAAFYPLALAPLDGGVFIMAGSNELASFDKNGLMRWRLKGLPDPLGGESLSIQAYSIQADPSSGAIYVLDMLGKTVTKLIDVDFAKSRGVLGAREADVLALAAAIAKKPATAAQAMSLVRAARIAESEEAALSLLSRAAEAFPDSDELATERDSALKALALAGLSRLETNTFSIVSSIGPESARQSYSETVAAYERYLVDFPEDSRARTAKRSFEEAYKKLIDPGRKVPPEPEFVRILVDNIVPAYFSSYVKNPPIRIELSNPGDKAFSRMRVEVFIRGYMDAPMGVDIPSGLPPKGTARAAIPIRLSVAALGLEEDLPVQAEIRLIYEVEGEQAQAIRSAPITIYRKSSISWRDTRSLAAFITPNDSIVSGFAAAAISGQAATGQAATGQAATGQAAAPILGKAFSRAVRILESVGASGIAYVEDPGSGVSAALGKPELMDTVRFPRATLNYRIGDCDDTTALCSSLLESAGIPTAIMTGPGHVYLAFSPEPDQSQAWMYASQTTGSIAAQGRVWIPVETTTMKDGFLASWRKAWAFWNSTDGKRELVPVASCRDEYPSVPLPESSLNVERPFRADVDKRLALQAEAIKTGVLAAVEAGLKALAAGAEKSQALKALNRIAILRIREEKWTEAEDSLKRALALDPASVQTVANLAGLKTISGKDAEGGRIVKDALAKKPESAVLNALYGQYLERAGLGKEAGVYLAKGGLKQGQSGEAVQRAADQGGEARLFSDPQE